MEKRCAELLLEEEDVRGKNGEALRRDELVLKFQSGNPLRHGSLFNNGC